MEIYKIWKICVRDQKRKSIIGCCFNRGIAKIWAESIKILINEDQELYIQNSETGETEFYNFDTQKWK